MGGRRSAAGTVCRREKAEARRGRSAGAGVRFAVSVFDNGVRRKGRVRRTRERPRFDLRVQILLRRRSKQVLLLPHHNLPPFRPLQPFLLLHRRFPISAPQHRIQHLQNLLVAVAPVGAGSGVAVPHPALESAKFGRDTAETEFGEEDEGVEVAGLREGGGDAGGEGIA